MAIQHKPVGNRTFYDLMRSFKPAGSDTIVWVQDMRTSQLVRLLRWGNEIYLPVYDGMKIGIGIYNGSRNWHAYPMYVEARNLWEGGPPQPDQCSTVHMWEMQPYQEMVIDKLKTPHSNHGRPLIITESGFGSTVGEATFDTEEFRGQIRVYERRATRGGYRPMGSNIPHREGRVSPAVITRSGGAESLSYGTIKGVSRRGSGRAGIGAGEEEFQPHTDTGISYLRGAKPVISLQIEYREDLQPLLYRAWDIPWNWHEPIPHEAHWWKNSWNWRPSPTMPEIPVTKPHRPPPRR